MALWLAALERLLASEQDRFALWLPVLFGSGIAIYFALPNEPALLSLSLAAALALAVTAVWRQGIASLLVGGALAGLALGLWAAKVASDMATASVLTRELRAARITGWVQLVEPRADGSQRITIWVAAIEGLASQSTPRRLRIRAPGGDPPLSPGLPISVTASLLPPAAPNLPGAYDFARTAWFQGIGAVGSARTRPEPAVIPEKMPLQLVLWSPVERLRQFIGQRISAVLPGGTGAIATALVTGERGGISEATNAAYRDSGIIHILSISGLHMTIFAGAVYVSVRFVLALFPLLSLRHPIKKWAAIAGISGTYAYLLISGGTPPAVRSAVMISIMFVAILLDSPALALRNVGLAALVILAVSPPSLIDVGFQMSFACVVALISGIEAWTTWRNRRGQGEAKAANKLVASLFVLLATIGLTTLIASLAAAPFGAYYFHKSTQYGILANLIAVPICNLLVMPAALATLIAMPAGLEAWPLQAMALGIDAMTLIAVKVAALPGAVVLIPEIPGMAFGLMIGGGLWLTLWTQSWRLLGVLPVLAGIGLAPLRTRPDVLVSGSGALVAVRGTDGRYAALHTGRSTFELSRWLEADADPRPAREVDSGRVFDCDGIGCTARVRGRTIAIANHPATMADDCAGAALVVAPFNVSTTCRTSKTTSNRAYILNKAALQREGTHAIRFGAGGIEVTTVAKLRGERPWSRTSTNPNSLAPD